MESGGDRQAISCADREKEEVDRVGLVTNVELRNSFYIHLLKEQSEATSIIRHSPFVIRHSIIRGSAVLQDYFYLRNFRGRHVPVA